jgi:hypothetical protein
MMREFGNDVMISAESSPELISADEELPDAPAQKEIEYPEVPADPKKSRKSKKKPKAALDSKRRPGDTVKISRRKPLPKPKDKKKGK